jgi:heme/copper-type cytochrome/quinol oxidase subunit 2
MVFDINSMLLIPVLCSTRIYANAIDVIHSIGLCSIGIRIDIIPGRNIAMLLELALER